MVWVFMKKLFIKSEGLGKINPLLLNNSLAQLLFHFPFQAWLPRFVYW